MKSIYDRSMYFLARVFPDGNKILGSFLSSSQMATELRYDLEQLEPNA